LYVNNLQYSSKCVGFYILRKLPVVFKSERELESIAPAEFDKHGVENIQQCLKDIKSKFIGVHERERDWWIKWESENARVLTSAADYVRAMKSVKSQSYFTPLAKYLFGRAKPLSDSAWRSKLSMDTSDINTEFQWPEVLAAATPSVRSEFDLHPPHPRRIIVSQNELVDCLKEVTEKVKAYYSFAATTLTSSNIKSKLNQKLQRSGHFMATSALDKKQLLEAWEQHDHTVFEAIFNKLSTLQREIVDPLCLPNQTNISESIKSKRNDIVFNRLILNEINGNLSLNVTVMNTILKLFRQRNEVAVSKSTSYHSSIFVDVETCTAIMNYDTSKTFDPVNPECTNLLAIDVQLGNLNASKMNLLSRIYFPYFHSDGVFGMIIMDMKSKCFYYVHHGNQDTDKEFLDTLLEKVVQQFNLLLDEISPADTGGASDEWQISLYPLNTSSCSDHYSGIFIATVLCFLVQECPVYIPENQLLNLKQKFAFWVIMGELPI